MAETALLTVATSAGVAVGWFARHFQNGKSSRSPDHSLLSAVVETKTLVQGNTQVLQEMARVQTQLADILSEIERRTRGGDRAIQKVLEG